MCKPIQSAIYLSGNKRKLWKQIKPFFKGRSTLVDVFTGSGTVALNSVYFKLFDTIYANDSLDPLIALHEGLKSTEFLNLVAFSNDCYGKTKEEYLRMRDDYNNGGHPSHLLLNLQYRSNSNMMRWNSKGDFNMTYGERHRYDEDRILLHHDLCQKIKFYNEDFEDFMKKLDKSLDYNDTVVYIDSPYQNTTAAYQDQGQWKESDDQRLLKMAEEYHDKGCKVIISNVFSNRGKENKWLIDWCELNKDKFNVHHLDMDYSNSSFRKSKFKTKEVLIVSK